MRFLPFKEMNSDPTMKGLDPDPRPHRFRRNIIDQSSVHAEVPHGKMIYGFFFFRLMIISND
jgi:hypothetical protein